MQNRTLIFLLLVAAPSLLVAEVFKGMPTRVQGSAMTIRWETLNETGVLEFVVVCREINGNWNWRPVGKQTPKGNGSTYVLEDSDIFKLTDKLLEYEIRAVDANGRVIESVALKTPFVTSAARRTWGSIKAMFR